MLTKLGKTKFLESAQKSTTEKNKDSTAQLEDCFIPENISEDDSLIWRSEEKKLKLSASIEAKNTLSVTVQPYLNTYKNELTPINLDQVLSNIESQIPEINYSYELQKYLEMNGIKHEYDVLSHKTGLLCNFDKESTISTSETVKLCSLTIHFDKPLRFDADGTDAEENKHTVAREALIHLIKKEKYKDLTLKQLGRMLPPRGTKEKKEVSGDSETLDS